MDKQEKLNSLFGKAKNNQSNSTFDQTKALFEGTVGVQAPISISSKGFGWTLKMKLLLWISGLSTVCFFSFVNWDNGVVEDRCEEGSASKIRVLEKEEVEKVDVVKEKTIHERINSNIESVPRLPLLEIGYPEQLKMKFAPVQLLSQIKAPLTNRKVKTRKKVTLPQVYRFPMLTPEETKANNKTKKRMMKIYNPSKQSSCVFVPSGTMEWKGSLVSVMHFRLKQMEVTNLEYRTFLFDLLIHGKTDDFLIAKPDQNKWVEICGESMLPMANEYFSNEMYDDYPVVNVSVAGAEMFCTWLNKNLRREYPNYLFNDFRLPLKSEWQYAASNMGKDIVYPWGTESVLNQEGCFLANFNTKGMTPPEREHEGKACGDQTAKTTAGYVIGNSFYTAKVFSYNPNDLGLFNLSGNVAELVKLESGNYGTCGGGWMDSAEDIKIGAKDPYEGKVEAHPNIGFRIISTDEVYFKKQ